MEIPHLFYLAWNGLIKNDSFRRLLLQTFSLKPLQRCSLPAEYTGSGFVDDPLPDKIGFGR